MYMDVYEIESDVLGKVVKRGKKEILRWICIGCILHFSLMLRFEGNHISFLCLKMWEDKHSIKKNMISMLKWNVI